MLSPGPPPDRHQSGVPWSCVLTLVLVFALIEGVWAGDRRRASPAAMLPALGAITVVAIGLALVFASRADHFVGFALRSSG